MNFKIIPLVVLVAWSCNSTPVPSDGAALSENEKYNIQKSIDLHNITAQYQFKKDSIDGKADSWSAPYDIKKDRFLTLDKYLEYCKAHKYDPKEYAKFID
jgi:hypothetical protein